MRRANQPERDLGRRRFLSLLRFALHSEPCGLALGCYFDKRLKEASTRGSCAGMPHRPHAKVDQMVGDVHALKKFLGVSADSANQYDLDQIVTLAVQSCIQDTLGALVLRVSVFACIGAGPSLRGWLYLVPMP